MAGPLKWYDANAKDNPEFLKALAEVRRIGVHEGWCYQGATIVTDLEARDARPITGVIAHCSTRWLSAGIGDRLGASPAAWACKRP
jgi:hypothetical protein